MWGRGSQAAAARAALDAAAVRGVARARRLWRCPATACIGLSKRWRGGRGFGAGVPFSMSCGEAYQLDWSSERRRAQGLPLKEYEPRTVNYRTAVAYAYSARRQELGVGAPRTRRSPSSAVFAARSRLKAIRVEANIGKAPNTMLPAMLLPPSDRPWGLGTGAGRRGKLKAMRAESARGRVPKPQAWWKLNAWLAVRVPNHVHRTQHPGTDESGRCSRRNGRVDGVAQVDGFVEKAVPWPTTPSWDNHGPLPVDAAPSRNSVCLVRGQAPEARGHPLRSGRASAHQLPGATR